MNEARFEIYPQTRRVRRVGGTDYGPSRVPTGEFGWRFRDPHGRFRNASDQIVAFSGSGFETREEAHKSVQWFLSAVGADYEDTFRTPPIIDVDD